MILMPFPMQDQTDLGDLINRRRAREGLTQGHQEEERESVPTRKEVERNHLDDLSIIDM